MTVNATQETLYFREVQTMRQRWLWILVILSCAGGIAGTVFALSAILSGRFQTSDAMSGQHTIPVVLVGVVGLAACVGTPVFLYLARLITEVRHDGFYVQYWPVHLSPRCIPLENVTRIAAVTYDPIGQYGGWGIRWTWKGKAYNAGGNRGVRIDYTNGRHLLIGSQRPDELAAAVARVKAGSGAPRL